MSIDKQTDRTELANRPALEIDVGKVYIRFHSVALVLIALAVAVVCVLVRAH